jgi:Leucine-rich repeat (LRR) protein
MLDNNLIENVFTNGLSNLSNLYLLDISFNRLTSLEWLSSDGLRNLRQLNLKNSRIAVISLNTFVQLKNLETLNISYNLLKAIGKNTLNGLVCLQKLDLSNNQIEVIEDEAFNIPRIIRGYRPSLSIVQSNKKFE